MVRIANMFLKDPDAILDYEFDWSAWLQSGETIASNEVTVIGSITKESVTANDTAVAAWVSGGTVGETATIACKITTSAARTDERTISLRIRER